MGGIRSAGRINVTRLHLDVPLTGSDVLVVGVSNVTLAVMVYSHNNNNNNNNNNNLINSVHNYTSTYASKKGYNWTKTTGMNMCQNL